MWEYRTQALRGGTPGASPAPSQHETQSQGERHPQGLHTAPSRMLLQPQRFLWDLSTSSCRFLAERKGGWRCPRGHVRAGGRLGLRGEELA